MKKIFFILILILTFFNAISQNTFNKLYSPYGINQNTPFGAHSILSNGTNYIVAAGGFDTIYNNYQCLFFYKFDAIGTATKIIGFSRDGYNYYSGISALINTKDGGYCYVGDIDSIEIPIHFIIRFDQNMDTLWTKYMPQDTIFESLSQIQETSDKGFIFVGRKYATPYNTNVLLIKTDSLGNQLWKKIIPMPYLSYGASVLETPDKGFLINGYSYNPLITGIGSPFLIKTDSGGNVIWSKIIGGNEYDGGGAMAVTSDGDYLYAFGYSTYTYPYNDSWSARLNIIKYAPNGTEIWNRMYDTIRNRLDVIKINVFPDNNFMVMGSHSEREMYNFFASFLFKFSANGDSLWHKIYFLADHFVDMNFLSDNVINADGGITACGWVFGDTLVPVQQIWILRTDSMGYAPGPQNVGIIDLPYMQMEYGVLKVFPNPANDFLIAEYTIDKSAKEMLLTITDMQGRLQMKHTLKTTTHQTLIDVSNLKNGTYHCTILIDGQTKSVTKIIVQH